MSETKKHDDYVYYMVAVWLPIMMLLVFTTMNHTDPYSLLTDEQKLEKQKEIALIKEANAKKWEQDKEGIRGFINYILKEKPFPYVHFIGLFIFVLAVKGYTNRERYGDEFLWGLMNPSFIIPLFVGFMYLAWLSGHFNFGV